MADNPSTKQDWSPPSDFVQVESKVPGIIVYAPKPEVKTEDQVKSYACPKCGANIAYDVSAGGIACEYCGYIAKVSGTRVGHQAEEFEFTLETVEKSKQGWGSERQVMHCDSCGGELSVAPGSVTSTCPFCGSNQVNVITTSDETLRPRFLVPFKVSPQQTQQITRDWLRKGWFHPKELAGNSIIKKFLGVYLPFWTFDTNVTADWRAEVGYERKTRHYNASSKSWETRTTIEWRWEQGGIGFTVDDLLITGSHTNHINHNILNQLYPFHTSDLVAYKPDFLAGWHAQAYETKLTEAWETAKTTIREQAKKDCYADIPTNHVRNFSMIADFADESWRYILLPVYITTYKYDQKSYQMMVNGQTGKVAGQKPVAWWKIWLVIAAIFVPGLILGLIGYAQNSPMIALGILLVIVGIVVGISLITKGRRSEKAK
jgi:predicted RNA-binding Zn-ribbon protein involved in translation (DUF1610 family)